MEEQTTKKEMKVIWTVVDRGPGKQFWTRVGVGFINRDGSINVRLDAIPLNGTLQVRDWQEPQDRRPDLQEPPPRLRAKPLGAADPLV